MAVTLVLAIVLAAACGDPAADTVSRPADLATDTLEELLVLGSLDGDGPDTFGRIAGVVIDSTGRIFVADAQAHEIRAFGPAGEYLFTLGREGEGPGELRSPCCLAWGPEGLLWARDRSNNRYSAFRVSPEGGDFARTVRMAHGSGLRTTPTTFRDSLLADIGMARVPGEPLGVGRFWTAGAGDVLAADTFPGLTPEELGGSVVRQVSGNSRTTFYLYQPFGPSDLIDFGPEGRVVQGVSSEYRLSLVTPDGDTVVIVSSWPPVPLSDGERRAARDQIDGMTASLDQDVSITVPGTKPPIADAWFDRDGRLWVAPSVAEGAPQEADIWNDRGELVGHAVWPADVTLTSTSWIGPDRIAGVRRDEFGVDYLVVLGAPRF